MSRFSGVVVSVGLPLGGLRRVASRAIAACRRRATSAGMGICGASASMAATASVEFRLVELVSLHLLGTLGANEETVQVGGSRLPDSTPLGRPPLLDHAVLSDPTTSPGPVLTQRGPTPELALLRLYVLVALSARGSSPRSGGWLTGVVRNIALGMRRGEARRGRRERHGARAQITIARQGASGDAVRISVRALARSLSLAMLQR